MFNNPQKLMDKEKVALLKTKYHGMDKYLYSKVKDEPKYGIALCANAKRLIRTPTKAQKEHRTLSRKVGFRLTDDEFSRLQLAIRKRGYVTTQDFMHEVVTKIIEKGDM